MDPRYVTSLLDTLGMAQCKPMATPGPREQRAEEEQVLDQRERREFMSAAGTCQYMTEHRFDIAYSTKEVMRDASSPATTSKTKRKRIARSIKGRPIFCSEFGVDTKAR